MEKLPIIILKPAEVARLLIATQENVPEFLAALVIKLFAGPRNTEIIKLTWAAIEEGEITLQAAFTKTRRLRGIEYHPTLAAWLDICRGNSDEKVLQIPPNTKAVDRWQRMLKLARVAAGFKKWPQNALRHAFCSYHFALLKDETLTAAIAGNSPAVIKANYLNAVKRKDCETFWRLTPATAEALAGSDSGGWVGRRETGTIFQRFRRSFVSLRSGWNGGRCWRFPTYGLLRTRSGDSSAGGARECS